MGTTEITLHFNKADFEELYFKKDNRNILLSKNVKEQFILSLIAILFFVTSLVYSIIKNRSWGIFTIITLLCILILNQLIRKVSPLIKWKRSLKDYLNEQSKFVSHKIALAENTLTLKQDTTITIVRWADFKKVFIDDKTIKLFGDQDFTFLKKSMTFLEFDTLKSEILLRIKR